MFFRVSVETEDNGTFYCVVETNSMNAAERIALRHYKDEGEVVESAEAEMFNSFEHGDPEDYDILS